MWRCFLLLAPLTLASPRTALAQTSIDHVIAGIRPGALIRIAMAETEYVGRFVSMTRQDVLIERHDRTVSIATQDVARLWIAEGRATREGFIRGAVIGGALGVTVGFLFGGMWCEINCTATRASNMLIAALTGAAAVGGVGAAVGSLGAHWRLLFP